MSWGIWIDLPEQVSWTRFLPLARPGIQDGQLPFLNAFRVSTTASAHLPSGLMWERAGPGALSRPPRGDRREAGGPSEECRVWPRTGEVHVVEGI